MKVTGARLGSTAGLPSLDCLADEGEEVDVEIQDRGQGQGLVLYVNVGGITLLRIGKITQEVEVKRS